MPKRRKFKCRANRFQLCSSGAPGDTLRVVRHVTFQEGQRLVKSERAEPVYEPGTAILIGFQLRACRMMPLRGEVAKSGESGASCVSLSLFEMEAAVGLHGRSQTEGLSESQRERRVKRAASFGRKVGMEDFVELARAKVDAYAPGKVKSGAVA